MTETVRTATRSESDVRQLIRMLVRELAPSPEGLSVENPRLIEDLGYHSLALLELAFTIEDEFGLEPIDQESAQRILTSSDVESYVVERIFAASYVPAANA